MTTVEKFTKNGHKVTVDVWTSNTFNFSIYIDDVMYDSGSALKEGDEQSEAEYWANSMCADIQTGRLVNVNDFWGLATESF